MCIHPNCKQNKVNGDMCIFHQYEMDNNNTPGHWNCTWCAEHKTVRVTNDIGEVAIMHPNGKVESEQEYTDRKERWGINEEHELKGGNHG